ncbi:MAG: polysaccharide biosynthesis protein [Candidatus Symbiothrix sp.]|jgi:FlaA1/EpsC-like NDP-sugar epimerase|nr:polysaccharide biosynthesis protein [Candidatus Symbiothrix sp.]
MSNLRKLLVSILSRLEKVPFLPKWIIFGVDLFIIFVSFTLSYLICFHLIKAPFVLTPYVVKMLLCLAVSGFFFYVFKTYYGVIRFSGFRDALRVFFSLFCANIVLFLFNNLINANFEHYIMPDVGFFINFIVAFTAIFFGRMTIRLLFDYAKINDSKRHKDIPVLIYGVSPSSVDLVRLLNHSEASKYKPVGFISPESNIANKRIINMPVYYIEDVFRNEKIKSQFNAIVINPKEIERKEKRLLSEECIKYKKELLSTPPLEDLGNEQWKFKNLKKVKIEDLLQRIPIEIDINSIGKNLEGKTLLITGAAGSIGHEIVRQVSKFKVGLLLVCDIAESPLHEVSMELNDKYPHIKYKPLIANVRDYDLMKQLFEKYRPDLIYHAAAYKHVPLMEDHPSEAVLTNVLGTKNLADLAVEYNVEAFVMISTDKAVNPGNVMGASKRIAEIYVQSLFKKLKEEKGDNATRFITTRFGNVLASNGSVIPRFEQQISEGGPVTVTHPDIIRYFMTIPEACRLVLEAGNFGKGGEVFVFDMGDSVKIKYLAEEMIRLSGFEPYKDINIVFTGLRPGEKLYEELLYDKETVKPTHNAKIKIGSVREYDYEKVVTSLAELLEAAKGYQSQEVVKRMKAIVPEFISLNSKYSEYDTNEKG